MGDPGAHVDTMPILTYARAQDPGVTQVTTACVRMSLGGAPPHRHRRSPWGPTLEVRGFMVRDRGSRSRAEEWKRSGTTSRAAPRRLKIPPFLLRDAIYDMTCTSPAACTRASNRQHPLRAGPRHHNSLMLMSCSTLFALGFSLGLLAVRTSAQSPVWGQCGGIGW